MNNLTINEIAKLAGVSKGTISKVLNDYPGINDKTRERVLKIVKDMGYEPNSTAHALASRQTGNLGFVIPHTPEKSLTGAYWSALLTVVTNEAIALGYNLVLFLPKTEGAFAELFNSIIRKRQVDGLLVGSEMLDTEQLGTFLYNRMPFAMIGRNSTFSQYSVAVDNEAAAHDITRYIAERGYKRVAFVTGPAELSNNLDRQAGYERALKESGLEYSVAINLPFGDLGAMTERITQLVGTDPPDAFLCGSGAEFMINCLKVLRRLGISLPETGFATFDDYEYLEFISPPITAVSQPLGEIGAAAVRMLDSLVQGLEPKPQYLTLQTEIVPRKSCGE